jgi:tetratricopeptide (TPR) repeat protein
MLKGATTGIILLVAFSTACGGGARVAPRAPAAASSSAPLSAQSLFEAGRYRDVIQTAEDLPASQVSPEHVWLAAQSYLRLDRQADARVQFERLSGMSSDPAWQTAARLALAVNSGLQEERGQAEAAAEFYPAHPFVQYQLGIAYSSENRLADAAQAFDRCIAAAPRFAYAYYQSALVYEHLDRADLTVSRMEAFVRLAPQAPERPAVESVLRRIRRE